MTDAVTWNGQTGINTVKVYSTIMAYSIRHVQQLMITNKPNKEDLIAVLELYFLSTQKEWKVVQSLHLCDLFSPVQTQTHLCTLAEMLNYLVSTNLWKFIIYFINLSSENKYFSLGIFHCVWQTPDLLLNTLRTVE